MKVVRSRNSPEWRRRGEYVRHVATPVRRSIVDHEDADFVHRHAVNITTDLARFLRSLLVDRTTVREQSGEASDIVKTVLDRPIDRKNRTREAQDVAASTTVDAHTRAPSTSG